MRPGLRVAGKSHWIHVARTEHLTHYGTTHDVESQRRMLSASYLRSREPALETGGLFTMSNRGATHALCNVHLIRDLVYVEEVCAEQQQWTRPLTKLLYDIKGAVEKAKQQGETSLSDKQLTTFTARYERLLSSERHALTRRRKK
jgi:transposase